MAKKRLTKAERAERDARHERVLANARRTRELAEQAQAKPDAPRIAIRLPRCWLGIVIRSIRPRSSVDRATVS
jgi:hypothetical protein